MNTFSVMVRLMGADGNVDRGSSASVPVTVPSSAVTKHELEVRAKHARRELFLNNKNLYQAAQIYARDSVLTPKLFILQRIASTLLVLCPLDFWLFPTLIFISFMGEFRGRCFTNFTIIASSNARNDT